MLSKVQSKYIRSLTLQKYRKEHQVFLAEGNKIALEWLSSGFPIDMILATDVWLAQNESKISLHKEAKIYTVKPSELQSLSGLKTANQVLMVIPIPKQICTFPVNEWTILADGIQDPGNLGTIIRIADWFGIPNVVTSPDTVDIWHPRVVQAAMGSHLRIHFLESDLLSFCQELKIPVLAATLGGQNIYKLQKFNSAALIIGNEGKGIRQELLDIASHHVTIPRTGGAESLNAAVSTGILCALLKG